MSFKSVESNLLHAVATVIDYNEGVILPIDLDVYEKHNIKIPSTTMSEFQVEHPFLGRG